MPPPCARRCFEVVRTRTRWRSCLLNAFTCLMCAWLMPLAFFDPLDLRRVTGHFRTERWENLQHELHSSHFGWKPIDKNRCKLPATFVPNDRNKFSARITQFSLLPEADRQKLLQISEILAFA